MAVVVITGASSGIGEATARRLARDGHSLVLAARRIELLERLVSELRVPALAVSTDVSDPAALEALAEAAVARFGQIDVWINNAGLRQWTGWLESSAEEVQKLIAVNLTGAVMGARAALRHMIPAGRGHIINVSSVAGYVATSSLYSATKFGLRGHTDAIRRELAPLGIQVSLLSPGFIKTEMTRDVPFPMPGPEAVAEAVVSLMRRPRREVIVPGWYRVLIGLAGLFPWLTDYVVRKAVMGREATRRV